MDKKNIYLLYEIKRDKRYIGVKNYINLLIQLIIIMNRKMTVIDIFTYIKYFSSMGNT